MQPSRLGEIWYSCPVYYLTLVAHNRNHICANAAMQAAFIAFAERATHRGVSVGRYVLMPDHIHLFAAFSPESVPLSKWIKSLKNSLSKCLRSRRHRAPHWQKGFFDHVLRNAGAYAAKWDYVRNNPLRAGLVDEPEKWLFQGQIRDIDLDLKNGRS